MATAPRQQTAADSPRPAAEGVRLQKILSQAGIASRRAAEQLIVEGRVSVNGVTVTRLGARADPARDDIRVDGRRVRLPRVRRYVLVNKPRGYVTTRRDPQGRPTVLDLLGPSQEYLYPVGRLDYASEGLVLLTNDGDLALRLMHPRYGVERVYAVLVRGVPDERDLGRLARGVVLDGRRTRPAVVRLDRVAHAGDRARAWLTIAIREGRHQQVRRMCQAVGHPVVRLRRVQLGPLADPRLKPGHARDLTPAEVAALKRAAGLVP